MIKKEQEKERGTTKTIEQIKKDIIKRKRNEGRRTKGEMKQIVNKIYRITCSLGFKINICLLRNSIAEREENQDKQTKEYAIQIKVKHINGMQSWIKNTCFIFQHLVAFS